MIYKPVVYSAVEDEIPQAALLLWRRGGLGGRFIANADRAIYCHVATAYWTRDWLRDVLHSLEFLQWNGPVRKPLAEYVREYPGRIDVFRPNANSRWDYNPDAAILRMVDLMREFEGRYGWRNLRRVGWWFAPVLRLFGTPPSDDRANGNRAPHCSMARSLIDQKGGVDPVLNTPAYNTTPGDYQRSLFFDYLFTLFDEEGQVSRIMEARR